MRKIRREQALKHAQEELPEAEIDADNNTQ